MGYIQNGTALSNYFFIPLSPWIKAFVPVCRNPTFRNHLNMQNEWLKAVIATSTDRCYRLLDNFGINPNGSEFKQWS